MFIAVLVLFLLEHRGKRFRVGERAAVEIKTEIVKEEGKNSRTESTLGGNKRQTGERTVGGEGR